MFVPGTAKKNISNHSEWLDNLELGHDDDVTPADNSRVTLWVAVTLLLLVLTLLMLAK